MSPRSSAPRAAAASLAERPPGEAVELGIGAVELGPVAVGALEVVADDLVLLDERRVPVEPVGEGSWSSARVSFGSES